MKRFKKELVDIVARRLVKISEHGGVYHDAVSNPVQARYLLEDIANCKVLNDSAYEPEPREFWVCSLCFGVTVCDTKDHPCHRCRETGRDGRLIRVREVLECQP